MRNTSTSVWNLALNYWQNQNGNLWWFPRKKQMVDLLRKLRRKWLSKFTFTFDCYKIISLEYVTWQIKSDISTEGTKSPKLQLKTKKAVKSVKVFTTPKSSLGTTTHVPSTTRTTTTTAAVQNRRVIINSVGLFWVFFDEFPFSLVMREFICETWDKWKEYTLQLLTFPVLKER